MNQNHFLTFVTLFSLIVQPASAQVTPATSTNNIGTSTNSVLAGLSSLPSAIFPSSAMPVMLQNATKNIQLQIYACMGAANATTAGIVDAKKQYEDQLAAVKAASDAKHGKTTSANKSGTCFDSKFANGNYDDKTDCDLHCDAPPVGADPSCTDYLPAPNPTTHDILNKAGEKIGEKELSCYNSPISGEQKYKDAEKAETAYMNFLTFKSDSCGSKAFDDYKKQSDVFNCEMGVLSKAVGQASNMVQSTLQTNNAQYAKMNQFQQELGSQISQIDTILGGDDIGKSGVGGQFGGLLGLQKDLTAKLGDMNNQQASFQNAVTQLQQDTQSNEQTLVSEQMAVAASCLGASPGKGDPNLNMPGAYSLTCRRARQVPTGQKDSTGNPIYASATNASGAVIYDQQSCGPVDFMKSEVEMNSYNSSRGVVVTEARKQQASQNVSAMDALMQSILRDLGEYDQPTDAGKLVTNATTWSQIESKYGSAMDSLAGSSGIDVRGQLRAIGGHCMNESVTWKRQQQLSSSSRYNTTKTKLKQQQATLAAQINTGMSGLNKDYADMFAALTGQVVTANRYACTTTDPASMVVCYTNMKQNAQDLLEGNANVPFVPIKISGGTMVQGFQVPCRGINGCVTSMKQVRDAQKKQSLMAEQQKTKFVGDSNQQVQTQVQGFAQFLSGIQSVVLNQFQNMNSILASKLHVAGPEQPKYMDPEQLEPSEGPNKEPGPFKPPTKMAAVLSGMVQPTGLIDFNAPGTKDGEKDALEKLADSKTHLKDAAKEARDIYGKLSRLESTCKGDAKCGVSDNVNQKDGSSASTLDQCTNAINSCEENIPDPDADGLRDSLQGILRAVSSIKSQSGGDDTPESVGASVLAIDGDLKGVNYIDCAKVRRVCAQDNLTKGQDKTNNQNKDDSKAGVVGKG